MKNIKYTLYNTQLNKVVELKFYERDHNYDPVIINSLKSDIYFMIKENGNEKELILNYKCYNYSVDNIREITESVYKKGFIYDN